MRAFIFTERERELLVRWVETGEEGQSTRDLFSKVRRNIWSLGADMRLMTRVIRRLQKERRWHARITRRLISG